MIDLDKHWRRTTALSLALLPLAALYCLVVVLRRQAYRLGLRRIARLPVPVIIVGNITVGGTGKTPLVIWLAQALQAWGLHPGIVSRGYRGRARDYPRVVTPESDPDEVGDEPVLLARHAGCPVVVDPDRVRAARHLLRHCPCDVILSDDGLQHYRLGRNLEIAVIDGERRFGNGHCLPAGPLREPVCRLRTVDLRVVNGAPGPGELSMRLEATGFHQVGTPTQTVTADHFRGRRVHAVAGIGHPGRFFRLLRELGLEVAEHPWPDHHRFHAGDIRFPDDLPVIMTEKDAVKCRGIADSRHWYLGVAACPDDALGPSVRQRLKGQNGG